MAISAALRNRVSAHEFDLRELSFQISGTDLSRADRRVKLIEELATITETELQLLATQGEDFTAYGEDGEVLSYYEVFELLSRSKVEVLILINAIDSAQEKTNRRRKAAAQALLESEY